MARTVILRLVIGVTWALVIGLAGGWLILSAWALGLQAGGWNDASRSEVGTGAFLALLGLGGLLAVVADLRTRFREVGLIVPRPRSVPQTARVAPGAAPEADVDRLLPVLAKVLMEELSQREAGQPQRQPQAELRRNQP